MDALQNPFPRTQFWFIRAFISKTCSIRDNSPENGLPVAFQLITQRETRNRIGWPIMGQKFPEVCDPAKEFQVLAFQYAKSRNECATSEFVNRHEVSDPSRIVEIFRMLGKIPRLLFLLYHAYFLRPNRSKSPAFFHSPNIVKRALFTNDDAFNAANIPRGEVLQSGVISKSSLPFKTWTTTWADAIPSSVQL